jgi:hypothetical protein
MKIVNSRKRALNRNTATYRKALRNTARSLIYRIGDDADSTPMQIARRYLAGADQTFLRNAIAIALPDAAWWIEHHKQKIVEIERLVALLSQYAAEEPARSPGLRLAVDNSQEANALTR